MHNLNVNMESVHSVSNIYMFSEHASDGRTYYINMDVAGKFADGGENSWGKSSKFPADVLQIATFHQLLELQKKNSRMILNPNRLTRLCIPRHNLAET